MTLEEMREVRTMLDIAIGYQEDDEPMFELSIAARARRRVEFGDAEIVLGGQWGIVRKRKESDSCFRH